MARCDVYKCDRCGIYVEKAVTVRASKGQYYHVYEGYQTKYVGFDVCQDCAFIVLKQWSDILAKKHREVAVELIEGSRDDFKVHNK